MENEWKLFRKILIEGIREEYKIIPINLYELTIEQLCEIADTGGLNN